MKIVKRPKLSADFRKCARNISIQSFNLFYNDIQNLMIHLNEKYILFQKKQYDFEEKYNHDLMDVEGLRFVRHQLLQSLFYKWAAMLEKYEVYDINNMIIRIKKSKNIEKHYKNVRKNIIEKDDVQLQVLYEEHIDLKNNCERYQNAMKEWIPQEPKIYRTELINSKDCTSSIHTIYRNQYECISDCIFDPESLYGMKPTNVVQNDEEMKRTGFIFGIPVVLMKKKLKSGNRKEDDELYFKIYDIVYNQNIQQKKTIKDLWLLLESFKTKSHELNEAKNSITLNALSEFSPHYCRTYFCSIDFVIRKQSKMMIPYIVQLKENIGTISIHNINRFIRYQIEGLTEKKLIERILIKKMNTLSSLFIQLLFALFSGQTCVSFLHQNLSSKNINVKSIYPKTNLYYEYNGIIYKVPTYGNLLVLHDFSNSTVKTTTHYSEPINILLHHRKYFDIKDFQYLDMMSFLRHYYSQEDKHFLDQLCEYDIFDELEPFKSISNYFLSCSQPLNSENFLKIHPVEYNCQRIFVDPYKTEEYETVNIEINRPLLESDEKQKSNTQWQVKDENRNILYKNMKECTMCDQQNTKHSFYSWHPITLKTLCSENASIERWFGTKTARSLIVEWEDLNNQERKLINHIKSFDYYR